MFLSLGAVAVADVEVLGCGVIAWKPPQGNECEELTYTVRFFDGLSYFASAGGYRNIQQITNTDQTWAIAEDFPTDGRTVRADVSIIIICFMWSC